MNGKEEWGKNNVSFHQTFDEKLVGQKLTQKNTHTPTSEESQQCIDEFFSITKDVINQDLIEFLATMDDVEFTDQDEWLFPAYLFTPEEEEKLGKAVEYYLKNAGDLYGKKN